MKKSFWLTGILLCLLFTQSGHTAEIKYKLSDIPANLKNGAKAVIRKNDILLEVKGTGDLTKTVHYAITVLNMNGVSSALFKEYYDRFRKVKAIKAAIYNANGELIKKFGMDDVLDMSAISGYAIYEDFRMKALDPACRTLPFTLEYSFEENYNRFIEYPDFYVYDDLNVSVEESSFTVLMPNDMPLRFLEKRIPAGVVITKMKDLTSYAWEVHNLPGLKEEIYSPVFTNITPVVYVAPTSINVEGHAGNCESWQNIGAWFNSLLKDRDILPEETVSKLNGLISKAKDDYEKIAMLYKYMQDKTRYVSIQIGIGGWQPFDAATVDRLGYGDCKALVNYMKAILKVAGISSYYTLVAAGRKATPMLVDFPSIQFNHVILCVPVKKDTLWLECTNQNNPCGYLGKFTDDRNVLIIDDDGGHIARTRSYTANEYLVSRKVQVKVNADGQGTARVNTLYQGLAYDDIVGVLFSSDADKKKMITNQVEIPSFELLKYSYTTESLQIPKVHESLDLALMNYGTQMNDIMIIPLNLMNKMEELPQQSGERKTDIVFRRSYCEADTIVYTIPAGYTIDKLPGNISFSGSFGSYSVTVEKPNSFTVIYCRNLSMNKGVYPLSAYEELSGFFEKVSNKDDSYKMIVKKM